MSNNTLVPDYLNIDFNTIKQKIIDQLSESDVFTDYNYEGANITILIELMAYLGELSTYYINKLAKNCYIDTADLYETVSRLVNLIGYYPAGYRSSRTTITLSLITSAASAAGEVDIDDILRVEPWKELLSTKNYNNENISFVTTNPIDSTVNSYGTFTITDIPVRQGKLKEYTYTGSDLIDNKIVLPFINFGYDDNIDDDYPSLKVEVNDEEWTRISDFYDELSGLSDEDNVYILRYDKYKRYIIEFSDTRNVPSFTDSIKITAVESLGSNGNVAKNTIIYPDNDLLTNNTKGITINSEYYTITNYTEATGGSDPESITEIKNNAPAILHAQYRNVTKNDYVSYLELRSDIAKANVWGEKEIAPSGDIDNYNKVYVSLIPTEWGSNTLSYSPSASDPNTERVMPIAYNPDWVQEIAEYLELRKMLCAWEVYTLPEIIYFRIDIGLKIKSNYKSAKVINDVKNKLVYYFSVSSRDFGETLNFYEIENYIKDASEVSDTDNFSNVKGITAMIVRNIDFWDFNSNSWLDPYSYKSEKYPQWARSTDSDWDENVLRSIIINYNQFPYISIDDCIIEVES